MARTFNEAMLSTENTTLHLCTGDIRQHKMPVREDVLRPPHSTYKSVVDNYIN